VDVSGAIEKVLDDYEQQMRRALSESKTPFTDIAQITVGGGSLPNALRITLAPNADADAVRAVLAKATPDLPLTTTTLSSGPAVQGVLTDKQIRERQDNAIQKNLETLRNRVNELG